MNRESNRVNMDDRWSFSAKGKIARSDLSRGKQPTKERNTMQLFELLPAELLDMILRKSYLFCVLNKDESIRQRDRDIICTLASVNYIWFQWVTSRKFKRTIWRHLAVYYDEAKKTAAILRDNRNYLLDNIQPSDVFVALLLSVDFLTEEQMLLISRLQLDKDKNSEILRVIRSLDETKYTNFINCLRQSDQWNVARVLETGGVVLKAVILNVGAEKKHVLIQQIVRILDDILNNSKESSDETRLLISELEKDGIHILSASVDKERRIVLWVWCRSEDSVVKLHEVYDSKRLEETLKDLFHSLSAGLEDAVVDLGSTLKLKIDESQFQR